MDQLAHVIAGPLRPADVKESAGPERMVPSSQDVRLSGTALPAMATRRDPLVELNPWMAPESGASRLTMPAQASTFTLASPATPAAPSSMSPSLVLPTAAPHAVARMPEKTSRTAGPPLLDHAKSDIRPAGDFRTLPGGQAHALPAHEHPNRETPERAPGHADVEVMRPAAVSPVVTPPLVHPSRNTERPASRPAILAPVVTPPLAPRGDGRTPVWRAIPAPPVHRERAVEPIERIAGQVVAQPLDRQPTDSAWAPRAPGAERVHGSWKESSPASTARHLAAPELAVPVEPVTAFDTAARAPARTPVQRAPRATQQTPPARPATNLSQGTPAKNPGREHPAPEPLPRALASRAAPSASAAPVPAAGPTARPPVFVAPATEARARLIETAPPRPASASVARPALQPPASLAARRALMTPAQSSRPMASASPHRSQPSAAASPSVSISIGRVEIIAPAPQQAAIPARAHQIDPGLHLGASVRGRL
jgi:hypothetical protein